MDIIGSKVLALALMQVLTLVSGLVPLKLIHYIASFSSRSLSARSKAEFCISLLNCFAGGVFLGTTFLHLLPEVDEQIGKILDENEVKTDFPVSMFIVSVGFFFIMIVEHVVMSLQHHTHGSSTLNAIGSTSAENKSIISSQEEQTNSYGALTDSTKNDHFQSDLPIKKHNCQSSLLADIESRDDNCVHIIHPTHHQKHHKDTSQVQSVRSVILLLALSIHTIFEGLALGLQTTTADVWVLFTAICIHKVIIAFTMGIQFTSTMSSKRIVVFFMVFFSLMSPIGVAIGTGVTAISTNGRAVDIANGSLQGIATGTFVFVTFFEVLQKEVGQDHSIMKVFIVIIGYALIALINLFSPKD